MNSEKSLSKSGNLLNKAGYPEYRKTESLRMIQGGTQQKSAYIHQTWEDFKSNTTSLSSVLEMNMGSIKTALDNERKRVASMSPWKKAAEKELKSQLSTMLALSEIDEQSIVAVVRKGLRDISNKLYSVDTVNKKRIDPRPKDRFARIKIINEYVQELEKYSRDVSGVVSGNAAAKIFEGNSKTNTSFRRLKIVADQLEKGGGSEMVRTGSVPDPESTRPVEIDEFNVWSMQTRTNLLVGEFYEQQVAQLINDGLSKMNEGDFDSNTVKVVGQEGGKTDVTISTAIGKMVNGVHEHLKQNAKLKPLDIGITVKSGKITTSGTYVNTGTLNTFPELATTMTVQDKNIVFYALANTITHEVGFHELEYFQDSELSIYNRYLDRLVLGDFSRIMFEAESSTPASLLITRDMVYTSRDISQMLFNHFESASSQLENAATDKQLTQAMKGLTKGAFGIELGKNSVEVPGRFSKESHTELIDKLKSTKVALKFRIGKNFSKHSLSSLM